MHLGRERTNSLDFTLRRRRRGSKIKGELSAKNLLRNQSTDLDASSHSRATYFFSSFFPGMPTPFSDEVVGRGYILVSDLGKTGGEEAPRTRSRERSCAWGGKKRAGLSYRSCEE